MKKEKKETMDGLVRESVRSESLGEVSASGGGGGGGSCVNFVSFCFVGFLCSFFGRRAVITDLWRFFLWFI